MNKSSRTVVVVLGVALAATATMGCRAVSRTCSSCCVSGWKDTMAGVEEGWVGGREKGASLDGAVLVFSYEDFKEYGEVKLDTVTASTKSTWSSEATLVVENLSEDPLRMGDLEIVALDAERFALEVDPSKTEVTVPPKAKKRIKVRIRGTPKEVGTIRLWEHELSVKEKNRQHAPPTQPF